MNAWWGSLFGRGVGLSETQRQRLQTWQSLAAADRRQAWPEARVVVVDVETTGLDMGKDRLIAIGAVAVVAGRIDLAQSFEVVLRQEQVSSHENILIHGIGGMAQREGLPPADALLDFLAFLGKSPLVAFHAAFDQTMIDRAMRTSLGLRWRHPWLDLAYVMPALLPGLSGRRQALDDWTSHFQIDNFARHSASADALATAQLLLCAMHLAKHERAVSYQALQAIEAAHHWTFSR
jgi:DNA polymerase III subunit epsilon